MDCGLVLLHKVYLVSAQEKDIRYNWRGPVAAVGILEEIMLLGPCLNYTECLHGIWADGIIQNTSDGDDSKFIPEKIFHFLTHIIIIINHR